jgi:hypothetical protein
MRAFKLGLLALAACVSPRNPNDRCPSSGSQVCEVSVERMSLNWASIPEKFRLGRSAEEKLVVLVWSFRG